MQQTKINMMWHFFLKSCLGTATQLLYKPPLAFLAGTQVKNGSFLISGVHIISSRCKTSLVTLVMECLQHPPSIYTLSIYTIHGQSLVSKRTISRSPLTFPHTSQCHRSTPYPAGIAQRHCADTHAADVPLSKATLQATGPPRPK